MAESKGNKKKHSARQKEHYKAHFYKVFDNKIKRLERHIRRNAQMVAKKTKKGLFVKIDQQAINRLKSLKAHH